MTEGRALPPIASLSRTAFRYEYQLTEHLDNLRTACRCGEKLDSLGNTVALLPSDNLRNLVQENAYDPWGLNLPDLERSAVLPDWWQFNTKERDYRAYDEFEFRHYDAAIGRFMSIDPLAQRFRGISPFNYADNNPSTFMDLYGLQAVSPNTYFDPIVNGGWLNQVVVTAQRTAPVYKKLVGEAFGGFATGVGSAVARNLEALSHPQQMVEGIARLTTFTGQVEAAVGMEMLYDQTRVAWNSGDVRTRADIVGNVTGEIVLGFLASKGTSALVKGGAAGRMLTLEMRTAGFSSRAATQGTTTALRKVGSVLESVDDVMVNPNLLGGQSYGYVRSMLGDSKNWVNDIMRQSSRADGWILRELNKTGDNFTGRMIQYHPGTPRHFGGTPYWKVSSGNGTFRIPLNP